MRLKSDKPRKHSRQRRLIVISIISLLILLIAGGVWLAVSRKSDDSAKKSADTQTVEQKTTTKIVTETSPIPFATTTQNDAALAKGATKTLTAGVDGEKTTTYEVNYDANGKEISRKVIKEETTKQPVDEIIANGTYVVPAKTNSTQPANNTNTNDSANNDGASYLSTVQCPQINAKINSLKQQGIDLKQYAFGQAWLKKYNECVAAGLTTAMF